MFTEITLKNFRTHKSTTIELHPITLLIDNNNSGKTNFLAGVQHFSQIIKRSNPEYRDSYTIEEKRTFERFVAFMRRFASNFQGVRDNSHTNNPYLRWLFDLKRGKKIDEFPSEVLSDGFIKAAAIALLVSLESPPSLILLEEVEKGTSHFGKKPNQLKQELYQTNNLSTITPEKLETKALKFIDSTTIKNIYSHVPEIRLFIQTLSCLSKQ